MRAAGPLSRVASQPIAVSYLVSGYRGFKLFSSGTKKAALVESSLPEREIDSRKVIKFPIKNNNLGNCVQLVLLVGFRL